VRDVGNIGQHHGQGEDPNQGEHHLDGKPLCIWPGKYLVSVNAESKETEHNGITRKVLGMVSEKNEDVVNYLKHGENKAEVASCGQARQRVREEG
jgi:hypothetical protein